MKLSDHTEHIRKLIESAFRNRLGRMGIAANQLSDISSVPQEYRAERKRIETIREVWIAETGTVAEAYEKLVEEFTFTLFNRLAALKVMEAHTLHPEIVTRRSQHGDRSFAHKHWLEQNPDGRNDEMEGLVRFLEDQLTALAADIPLFSPQHPYHLLPTAIELNGIMNAFNQVETDTQVENNIWQSDDVLGWLYESYNNTKKQAHKDSGEKTEFNKVSIQSQVYTPRWVVKFLVDNSLGKLYLEMYPDSDIKNRYKIANAPKKRTREPKPLTEIRLIDPATGGGNFLLYGFDLFYDLYTDQIEKYGADYDDRKIAELIIANNLHGIDLDDRAIQLAQLGLYIKAKRKKRSAKIEHFNIVSSDFYLPEYVEVKHLFESEQPLSPELEKIVTDLWADLQQAYKFGALIRLEEKFSMRLHGLVQQFGQTQTRLFEEQTLANYENFRDNFFTNLQKAVAQNTAKQGQTFLNTKTQDAITFLQLLTQKYDVAVANPPYTDSSDFGTQLKKFIETNYKKPFKFNSNLYSSFIKRCLEITTEDGIIGLLHPLTFMYISSFEDVRKVIIDKTKIQILVELGLGGVFANSEVQADVVAYILEKKKTDEKSIFIDLKRYKNHSNKPSIFQKIYETLSSNVYDKHVYTIQQTQLKEIEGYPFIYWISDLFREKFKLKTTNDALAIKRGCDTSNNDRVLRFWWEVQESNYAPLENYPPYAKGGPYKKWYGNLWLTIDFKSSSYNFIKENGNLTSEEFYFREGITSVRSGSKGPSYRYLPKGCVFDNGGTSIFPNTYENIYSYLAYFNSKLANYIINCLNPTVNTQIFDIKRMPFVVPTHVSEFYLESLSKTNVEINQYLATFNLIDPLFKCNQLMASDKTDTLRNIVKTHLNLVNYSLTHVLINEAILNNEIFKVYGLSDSDKDIILEEQGVCVADLPVLPEAKRAFLKYQFPDYKYSVDNIKGYVISLPEKEFSDNEKSIVVNELSNLYKGNNDLESFCDQHHNEKRKYQSINPINIWYWFNESSIVAKSITEIIAMEFLTSLIKEILMDDEDGIVPLFNLPEEIGLLNRVENKFISKAFSSAQFFQLEVLLGSPLEDYINNLFLKKLSSHLALFKQLPSTPFIWHLSSGEHRGFEAYIIIYKWNRDSLYKLKSSYLSKRTESLQYRLQQIADSTTGQAQTEKETIRLQLQEIEAFGKKIDELIAEGYNPKLDDGVGKNIAPLQAKGMLKAEVLKTSGGKKSQLEKYLNADW
ncbi:hypothetical protein BH10BAC2_BH10BAC2_02250 [soil metagenome]